MEEMNKRYLHYKKLLLKPIWILITTYFLGILGWLQSIRDEFLPPDMQQKLRLLNLLPRLPWYYWVILILIATVIIILESGHRQIYELEKELEKDEVIAKVVLTNSVEFYQKGRVTLLIHNNDDFPLTECYARLDNFLTFSKDDRSAERTKPFGWGYKKFRWSSQVSKDGDITINRGEMGVLEIAEIHQKSLKLLFHNPDANKNSEQLGLGHHALFISLNGKLNGKPIKPLVRWLDLQFTTEIPENKELYGIDGRKIADSKVNSALPSLVVKIEPHFGQQD